MQSYEIVTHVRYVDAGIEDYLEPVYTLCLVFYRTLRRRRHWPSRLAVAAAAAAAQWLSGVVSAVVVVVGRAVAVDC